MVVVPIPILVTIPLDAFTVATARLVLVHAPPGVVLANVVFEPIQINVVPVIALGLGFIVTVVLPVEEQEPLLNDVV
jgi:hypothetical protein